MLQQAPFPTTPPPGVDLDTVIAALAPVIFGVLGLIVGGVLLYRFLGSDLAAAMAERIRAGIHRQRRWKGFGGEWSDTPTEGIDAAHVAELEQKVVHMQGQIAEMAERLDFAERLLAQKRERSLPGA